MEPKTNSPTTNVPQSVQLPAPTAWPIIFALGLTLLFAGLLSNVAFSIIGAVLGIAGAVGWFRDILPHEREETVPVTEEVAPIIASKEKVARMRIDPEIKRVKIPVEIYPYSAGVKG